VVTAGGLIFFAGNEGKLYAYDKETGKVVFTKDVPNGSAGFPRCMRPVLASISCSPSWAGTTSRREDTCRRAA